MIMHPTSKTLAMVTVAFACCLGLFTLPAKATFHLWKIDQVYSNASGSVQFIEFQQPSSEFDDERFVGGLTVTDSALGHSFTFPANLPAAPVANQRFLIATPGYAALKGVPAPDYTLGANDFFKTSGDTLTYAGGVDSLTFSGSQLPTDGVDALFRAYGASTFTTGKNAPTNFAGQTGSVSVPEPATVGVVAVAMGLGLLRRRKVS